jgi:hypothetical protein
LFDENRLLVASSRVGAPRVSVPADLPIKFDRVAMAPLRVDEDLLPTSLFAVPLTRLNQPAGWLVGELNLEEMWRVVDSIRIGERGFALVAAPDGALVAHGDPDKKALVAQAANIAASAPPPGPSPVGGSYDSGVTFSGGGRSRPRLDADGRAADQRGLRDGGACSAGCTPSRARMVVVGLSCSLFTPDPRQCT